MNFIITLIALNINLPVADRTRTQVRVTDGLRGSTMEALRQGVESAYKGVSPEFRTKQDVEGQAEFQMSLVLGGTEEVEGVCVLKSEVEWDRVALALRDVLVAEFLHPEEEMTEEEWEKKCDGAGDGFPWDGEPEPVSDGEWRQMEHQADARQTGFSRYTEEEIEALVAEAEEGFERERDFNQQLDEEQVFERLGEEGEEEEDPWTEEHEAAWQAKYGQEEGEEEEEFDDSDYGGAEDPVPGSRRDYV